MKPWENGLAEYGAKVVIAGLDLSRAKEVAQDIKDKYPSSEATAIKCDVTDENSVASFRDKVVSQFRQSRYSGQFAWVSM